MSWCLLAQNWAFNERIISLWQREPFLSVFLNSFSFSYPPPLFLSLILVFIFTFLFWWCLIVFVLFWFWFPLLLLLLFYFICVLVLLSFLFVVSSCSSRFFRCLWCIGAAGSQSERRQSGTGGQHPAGEWCSEDKPSRSRTGNKPIEHHLEA